MATIVSNPRRSGPLLQGYVRNIAAAHVDLFGTIDAVVLGLFEPVGQPAGYAGDGEDGREEIARNSQRFVDDARIEIDVRIDALGPRMPAATRSISMAIS